MGNNSGSNGDFGTQGRQLIRAFVDLLVAILNFLSYLVGRLLRLLQRGGTSPTNQGAAKPVTDYFKDLSSLAFVPLRASAPNRTRWRTEDLHDAGDGYVGTDLKVENTARQVAGLSVKGLATNPDDLLEFLNTAKLHFSTARTTTPAFTSLPVPFDNILTQMITSRMDRTESSLLEHAGKSTLGKLAEDQRTGLAGEIIESALAVLHKALLQEMDAKHLTQAETDVLLKQYNERYANALNDIHMSIFPRTGLADIIVEFDFGTSGRSNVPLEKRAGYNITYWAVDPTLRAGKKKVYRDKNNVQSVWSQIDVTQAAQANVTAGSVAIWRQPQSRNPTYTASDQLGGGPSNQISASSGPDASANFGCDVTAYVNMTYTIYGSFQY
jgi:hypothetical protein